MKHTFNQYIFYTIVLSGTGDVWEKYNIKISNGKLSLTTYHCKDLFKAKILIKITILHIVWILVNLGLILFLQEYKKEF